MSLLAEWFPEFATKFDEIDELCTCIDLFYLHP